MTTLTRFQLPTCIVWLLCVLLGAGPALADKEDRTRPVALSFDRRGTSDLTRGRTEIVGDAVLSQGSTLLRAERVDVRETPDGFYRAVASGVQSRPVSFRQGRDAPGAFVIGSADQLDYDSRASSVRLQGRAHLRADGARVAMDVTGASVAYDNRADVLVVEAGSGSPNPKGRGRILYLPPTPAGVAPGDNPVPLQLQPSLTLRP